MEGSKAADAGELSLVQEGDMDLQTYGDDSAERPVRAFLTKLASLLKGKVSDDDFKHAIKTARSHAGGKAPKKKKDTPADKDAIAAGEWVELWLGQDEVRRLCESCADDMESNSLTEVLVFGEDWGGEPEKALVAMISEFEDLVDEGTDEDAAYAVSLSEDPEHQEFISKRDPGFHRRCVRTIGKKARNPAAFSAWFHRKLLGTWPGEKKHGENDPEAFYDDLADSGYPAPKLEKTDKRAGYKADGSERCAECRFFLSPHGCRFVEGTIDREYYCKLWTARPAMFDEGDDTDLDALVEQVSAELESHTFKGKVPAAFLKYMKKKGDGDGDDDEGDGKKKKKKMPAFLAKKLGRKTTELYDFIEFRGESEHRSTWRLFLELGDDPEWIPYLPKPGNYKHPKYGDIAITKARNERFVGNFRDKVYQETLPIDAEHSPKTSGAMGWVVGMKTNEDGSADAKIKWTDRGRDMLEKDRFRYFSPEWYSVWEDPSTGKKHFDVAIGGALTTRPFFKEGALRSLVACEGGMYSPRGGFFREEAMVDEKKETTKAAGDDKHIDPQTFEELVESNRQLSERVGAQDKELKVSTEKVSKLEDDALRVQIANIVSGSDEKVGGPRWFGEPVKNVDLLMKMAEKFDGLESDECKQYIEQQKAYAEQLAASTLLTAIGSDTHGSGGVQDAAGEFNARAEKRLDEKKKAGDEKFVLAEAMSEIANEQPALYEKYKKETEVKV